MRIAFLPSSYLPENIGGTEIYVHHLAEALTDSGHEIAVVCHRAPARQETFNYEVVNLDLYPPTRRADLFLYAGPGDPPGLAEFVLAWRPDVLHFHALTLGAGLAHARVARRLGVPYAITYHTPTFSCRRGTLMRWGREACDGRIQPGLCAACVLCGQGWPRLGAQIAAHSPVPWHWLPEGPWMGRLALPSLLSAGLESWREFMLGAAHIVACAAWCRDVLMINGVPSEKITVLRQALPGCDRFRRLRLPQRKTHTLRLGFFGRVCWVKGPDLLLQAAKLLAQEGLSVVCELVGPIPENEKAWAQKLLGEHGSLAVYHGVKRGRDLTDWLAGLDLVVIPSRWLESGPLTLLEAWDQSVCVIGSDLGGIREFMDEAGLRTLLFKTDEAADLARTIRRAVEGNAAAATLVTIPGMTELARRMEAIYARIGSSDPKPERQATLP